MKVATGRRRTSRPRETVMGGYLGTARTVQISHHPGRRVTLTCGVDIQRDRIGVPSSDGVVTNAQPSSITWCCLATRRERGWEKLDAYLAQPITNSFGVAMGIGDRDRFSYLQHDVLNFADAQRSEHFRHQGHAAGVPAIISRPATST
jgi:hypothetical protein